MLKTLQYIAHQCLAYQFGAVRDRIALAIAFQGTELAVIEHQAHAMGAFAARLTIFLLRVHIKI